MSEETKATWLAVIVMSALLIWMYSINFAIAKDSGQWSNVDPELKKWYSELQQPDNAPASCCGEADAYWCDGLHVRDGKTFCVITDDRDNIALRRTPVPIGTEIEIPDRKLNKDPNPTGHAIVFLSAAQMVYCYVGNSGS